jgi:hypothetical protein
MMTIRQTIRITANPTDSHGMPSLTARLRIPPFNDVLDLRFTTVKNIAKSMFQPRNQLRGREKKKKNDWLATVTVRINV